MVRAAQTSVALIVNLEKKPKVQIKSKEERGTKETPSKKMDTITSKKSDDEWASF